MSLKDVYNNTEICKLEEKFAVLKSPAPAYADPASVFFTAKYPLEPVRENMRGTYGGEFVAQGLVAACESIDDKLFDVHSLHSYFLKAGLMLSVMRYEVTITSQGRNYCSRLVKCYQLHANELCFILMASFTRNNSVRARQEHFSNLSEAEKLLPRTKVPFEFLRTPHYTFNKYKDKLEDMSQLKHTNGNMVHVLLPETWKGPDRERKVEPGGREFGLFFKVLDNPDKARDSRRAKMVDFAFASDSFYLSTVLRAIVSKLNYSKDFFCLSLDHTIYFHDTNFDPTEWMFLDYKFMRLSNDRVLVVSLYFTMDKRLVATVFQEAMALLPLFLAQKSKFGSYKL
ncbi:Thioesterase/thiol ester dehydrase-isomerase [Metschnikowia bicuspidata]|uniref:Thioesterase/thiol ester dehydrase-isomerase n=1 Tax=Metschnikowia bicuspidata TaxID=27322 RepID=A0A4P9ZBS8_9ASCO|nr:Thioesterase/thiol ester dehydrase-isomerase [Metschnikowia bicuspidata]